jgi:hypothetical protein
MQAAETGTPQAHDPLVAYPPILVVGTKMVYLRAYSTVEEAVDRIRRNFLEGGYLEIYGTYDRHRLVDELRFFDAAGRELELIWDPEYRPNTDAEPRLKTLAVKHYQHYVRSRFRAMLHEVRPAIEEQRLKDEAFDDSPDRLPDEKLSFEELSQRLVAILAEGWWHRVLGGH